jgi:hypothetical protein
MLRVFIAIGVIVLLAALIALVWRGITGRALPPLPTRLRAGKLRGQRTYDVEVARDPRLRKSFSRLCALHLGRRAELFCEAVLVLEPGEAPVQRSVRVDVGSQPIGYLSAAEAQQVRQHLEGRGERAIAVDAVIRRSDASRAPRLWLDMERSGAQ